VSKLFSKNFFGKVAGLEVGKNFIMLMLIKNIDFGTRTWE
jgi:hypothetical protein